MLVILLNFIYFVDLELFQINDQNFCNFFTRPPKVPSTGYLVPENFQQRNLELIQSIRKYLHNDESKFNQFKNYSAQFRQVSSQRMG